MKKLKAFMKFQREADPQWAQQVAERPGCEGLFSCLQCGTCSGTCPLSIYMDFAPRRIIALVREGFKEDALSCQTIWLCASCYACAVHCPRQIHITDVMYSLKREAIQQKLYPKRFSIPVLAQALKKVGVPVEIHIYNSGGHGFGIRPRPLPISSWPLRLQEWMMDSAILPKN